MALLKSQKRQRGNCKTEMTFLLATGLILLGTPCWATDGMASNALVNRAGLTVDWFNQAPVSVIDQIVDLELNIDEGKSTTFFVIEAGNYREVISENDLNAFGEPYGLDGAVGYIEVRKEVLTAELASRGMSDLEIKVDQFALPETTIYLMSGEGLVTAINGDTGKTKWSTQVGDARLPSIGLGVSDDNVAAVNGSTLYFLEASTGKLLWSKPCQYAVGAPPAISPDNVFVPLFNGQLESFPIKDSGAGSAMFVAYGACSAQPLVTERTVAWPSRNGSLNVAALYGKRNNEVSYRLNTDAAIVSSPTLHAGMMYTGSLDGFVYAIEEKTGKLNWEVSLGEAVAQSPIPLGDKVFVITEDGRLFALSAADGNHVWDAPTEKVDKYIGSSLNRLYLSDRFGQLITVNKESGAVLSRVEAGDISFVLPNYDTDRLYFGTDRGLIQCLREVSSKIPFFHSDELEMKAQPAAATAGEEKPAIAADDDPFATPAGNSGANRPSTAADDPFAIPNQPGAAPAGGAGKAGGNKNEVEDDPFK